MVDGTVTELIYSVIKNKKVSTRDLQIFFECLLHDERTMEVGIGIGIGSRQAGRQQSHPIVNIVNIVNIRLVTAVFVF